MLTDEILKRERANIEAGKGKWVVVLQPAYTIHNLKVFYEHETFRNKYGILMNRFRDSSHDN